MPNWFYTKPESKRLDLNTIAAQPCAACGGRPGIYLGRSRVFCKNHKAEAVQDLKGFWKKGAK